MIIYTDIYTDLTCYSDTIMADSCEDEICKHLFDISLSNCPPTTNITITVFATNILGNGQMSTPINIGMSTMSCNHCIINYMYICLYCPSVCDVRAGGHRKSICLGWLFHCKTKYREH